jgi:branched-chain amino acid aminotransferase
LKVWLNGTLVEEDEARISPVDRGFLLGDGVFETLRTYDRRPAALTEHLERLAAGSRALGIPLPATEVITNAVRELLAVTGVDDVRVRITVTSGPGPAGPRREESAPTLLITASPLTAWADTATAVVAPWAHDEHSPLAGVKSTSRADTVLAMMHAREHQADEALFMNLAGNLCEATTANVFVVRAGRVETPPLSAGCLAGITREHVLRLCRELRIEAVETDLPRRALAGAEEIFLTSSTREIQALVALDGRPVGSGDHGPLTARLKEELSRRLKQPSD